MLAMVLVGCEKGDSSGGSNDAPHAKSGELSSSQIQNIVGPDYEFVTTCEGDCAEDCLLTDVGDYFRECNCDECSMQIMLVGEGGPEEIYRGGQARQVLKAALGDYEDAFLSELEAYIREYERQVELSRFSLLTDGALLAVRYHLRLSNGEEETVTFTAESTDDPVYTVTCDGGCGNNSESCRERFIYGNPPSIECTCEGNCSMKINGPGLTD